jgi:hypothetical protein
MDFFEDIFNGGRHRRGRHDQDQHHDSDHHHERFDARLEREGVVHGAPAGAPLATCRSCSAGFSRQPGFRFCPCCGVPLTAACPACGAPGTPGATFCQECGRRL